MQQNDSTHVKLTKEKTFLVGGIQIGNVAADESISVERKQQNEISCNSMSASRERPTISPVNESNTIPPSRPAQTTQNIAILDGKLAQPFLYFSNVLSNMCMLKILLNSHENCQTSQCNGRSKIGLQNECSEYFEYRQCEAAADSSADRTEESLFYIHVQVILVSSEN